ncbi:MAG TPA: DNA methyltransferase [Dehalococcoidia bacterium]|nr:DNA methyltransferase [Dehalococcoidia bacterium]
MVSTVENSQLSIGNRRVCDCQPQHINCLTAKEWITSQLGVWRFAYESRDIRNKKAHPATFPIALAKKCISLFTHEGELVLEPFMGSGTTLVAAQDLNRNAVGFDLHEEYVELGRTRLLIDSPGRDSPGKGQTSQIARWDDARNIPAYIEPNSVSLILTSPPYANLLNRPRLNKSRRGNQRDNDQYLKVEQYSQDPRDLGTMTLDQYQQAMAEIFAGMLPLLREKGHCVINVPDMWWDNQRVTIHMSVVDALREVGYELRNIVIWDRTNIVNRIGIFGWPSNYITMGTTFEYLLDFWKPTARPEAPRPIG